MIMPQRSGAAPYAPVCRSTGLPTPARIPRRTITIATSRGQAPRRARPDCGAHLEARTSGVSSGWQINSVGHSLTAVSEKATYPNKSTLPRRPVQDPANWALYFEQNPSPLSPDGPLKSEDLKEEIQKCGDFVNLTYTNFIANNTALGAFKDAARAQNLSLVGLENKEVGGFKYSPSEVMQAPGPGSHPTEIDVPRDSMVREYVLGIADKDGQVEDDPTFFLQATSGFYRREFTFSEIDLETTNWVGFVGTGPVSKDCGPVWMATRPQSLDIIIAFRGTTRPTEWLSNVTASMVNWSGSDTLPLRERIWQYFFGSFYLKDSPKTGRVRPSGTAGRMGPTKGEPVDAHLLLSQVRVSQGFDEMYRRFTNTPGNTLSLQGQVRVAVRKLLARYGNLVGSITVTGHSLGGALAQLCALDLVASGVNHQCDDQANPRVPVTAITLETPRAGNWAFADFFERDNGPRHLRITNVPDVVPKVPYLALAEGGIFTWAIQLAGLIFWYVRGVFGRNAGKDWQRPPKGQPENRIACYHAGTPYKVDTRTEADGPAIPVTWWRRLLNLPLFPCLSAIVPDIQAWHDATSVVMAATSPQEHPAAQPRA